MYDPCFGLQVVGQEGVIPLNADGQIPAGKFSRRRPADLRWVRYNKKLLGTIEELLLPGETGVLWEGEVPVIFPLHYR